MRVRVRRKPDRETLQLYYTDPLTGKDHTRSAKTANWRESERAAAAWEQELAKHGVVDADPTWDALRTEYERTVMAAQSASTQAGGFTAFEAFELVVPPITRISAINSLAIERAAAQWRKDGRMESTIGLYLSRIRTVLRWAYDHDLLGTVPRFPRTPRTDARGRPITLAEYQTLARAARDSRPEDWRQWVRFLRGIWLTGLRLVEAQTLDWSTGPLQVDLTGGKYPRLLFQAKGQKARRKEITPLAPDAAAWLARTPLQDRTGRVFPLVDADGLQMLPGRVARILTALGQDSGIITDEAQNKHVTAHDLRKSFGTRWSYRLRPLTLQKMMRHANLATTMKYYVAQDVDKVAEELWN